MLIQLIEGVYRLLWGDLLTLHLGNVTLSLSFMVILLLTAGVFFTLRTRLLPVRLFRDMLAAVCEKNDKGSGLSSFQTLVVSTATRVGMGNLVGVVAALSVGGAGAVFWDVGDGSAGRLHLLCGVHAGPEIQAARPPLRRVAGRPGLLSPHPRGAQTGQEAPPLGGGLPVRRVGPHLLVRHQSGGQQLGERGVPECVLHPAAGHDAGADGACGGHRPAEGGHRQEPRRHGPYHGGLLLRHDPLDHPHPSAPAARCLRPHFLGGAGPASGCGRRLWRCGDERHQAGPLLQRGRFRLAPCAAAAAECETP